MTLSFFRKLDRIIISSYLQFLTIFCKDTLFFEYSLFSQEKSLLVQFKKLFMMKKIILCSFFYFYVKLCYLRFEKCSFFYLRWEKNLSFVVCSNFIKYLTFMIFSFRICETPLKNLFRIGSRTFFNLFSTSFLAFLTF